MKLTKQDLRPAAGPVYDFDNHPVPVQGIITLLITMGEFLKASYTQCPFRHHRFKIGLQHHLRKVSPVYLRGNHINSLT
ncbi:hypothetical protein KSP40_PGU000626 [Platanthera guangdongensis]|uniref:Uncharacterized protein n=1 Tax=Platanthera guangdongensis TaxID=2320717 RepID=A0ABR2MEE5_9ASPA